MLKTGISVERHLGWACNFRRGPVFLVVEVSIAGLQTGIGIIDGATDGADGITDGYPRASPRSMARASPA